MTHEDGKEDEAPIETADAPVQEQHRGHDMSAYGRRLKSKFVEDPLFRRAGSNVEHRTSDASNASARPGATYAPGGTVNSTRFHSLQGNSRVNGIPPPSAVPPLHAVATNSNADPEAGVGGLGNLIEAELVQDPAIRQFLDEDVMAAETRSNCHCCVGGG
ncbi:expressed unknown protein [Seminavis robusta]|uniref:Uncharacterized protein n=1 Tax=Seminavis robusta TaxID=568900 RepID=A0A9N8H5S5_9STRA|nr:expressed unknown protein [Seminavis robusta]|eukprot:Sro122_g059350.1 n/a (160) ;mRNA; f:109770-110249